MDSSSISMIVAIALLVMMSAYFSATETAFSCMNKIRMKNRADAGERKAVLALALAEDFDRLISTILIGNNIVNITATTIGTVLFTKLFREYGPTVSTVVLTLVVLIFGEISPKSIAKENAESFAMFSAPLLRVLLVILRPLNFLFTQWKRLLNLVFRPSGDTGITEEELITMVSEAENEGGLDQHESQLIRSAIEFGDLEAGDILTPRVDIVAVEDSATMDEIAANCNRVIVLHEGKLLYDTTPAELFADPEAIALTDLGYPHSVHIKRLLEAKGISLDTDALDAESLLDALKRRYCS